MLLSVAPRITRRAPPPRSARSRSSGGDGGDSQSHTAQRRSQEPPAWIRAERCVLRAGEAAELLMRIALQRHASRSRYSTSRALDAPIGGRGALRLTVCIAASDDASAAPAAVRRPGAGMSARNGTISSSP